MYITRDPEPYVSPLGGRYTLAEYQSFDEQLAYRPRDEMIVGSLALQGLLVDRPIVGRRLLGLADTNLGFGPAVADIDVAAQLVSGVGVDARSRFTAMLSMNNEVTLRWFGAFGRRVSAQVTGGQVSVDGHDAVDVGDAVDGVLSALSDSADSAGTIERAVGDAGLALHTALFNEVAVHGVLSVTLAVKEILGEQTGEDFYAFASLALGAEQVLGDAVI
jgi:hypothetical protein